MFIDIELQQKDFLSLYWKEFLHGFSFHSILKMYQYWRKSLNNDLRTSTCFNQPFFNSNVQTTSIMHVVKSSVIQ